MKLICERTEDVGGLIVESRSGVKQYFIEGIFLQSNVVNRNKRIYPRAVLEKEVERYVNEHVKTNRAVGELGHPEGPKINETLISHKIVSLKQDGDNFIGKGLILETPNGKIVRGLIDGGVLFGSSSRALGALKKNSQGINEVTAVHMATASDIVMDPSAPSAFVEGIMEGAEFIYDAASGNYQVLETIENIQTELSAIRPSRMDEATKLSAFERFMNQLSQISK